MKKTTAIISMLTCLLWASLALARDCPREPAMSRTVQAAVHAAQKLVSEKKEKQAAADLDKWAKENPDTKDHYLCFYRGILAYQQKQLKKAAELFTESLKIYPCYAASAQNLAVVRFEQEKYIEAAELMLLAYDVAEKPDPEALYSAGVFYMAAKKADKGLPILQKLAAMPKPKAHWLAALVQCYLNLKQPRKAEPVLEKLLQIQPDKDVNWRLLASIKLELNDYAGAAAALEVAYRLKPPENAASWRQLGDIHRAAGAPKQAAKRYLIAFGAKPTPKDRDMLARVYLEGHFFNQALEQAVAAAKAKPTAKRWTLVGRINMMRKHYGQAYNAFSKAASIEDKDGKNSLLAGYAAWQMEKAVKAEEAFNRAAKRAEKDSRTAAEASRCLKSVRAWRQAMAEDQAPSL